MATPTAISNAPKPAGGGPQNASTPQSHAHLAAFSSPAPRSVPSPAAQRQHASKSPFDTSTHPPTTGSIIAHNHPTGGSSASVGRLVGSSPAAGALHSESPAAMALSMSMSGFDASGGLGMAFSMSNISGLNMGAALSARGRSDDEERRRRLERVVELLNSRSGRVSPEGLELLAKRAGLDTVIEANRRTGTTDVAIAGNTVVVEVKFGQDSLVKTVSVQLPTSTPAVNDCYKTASDILLKTLSVPSRAATITTTLAKFARNLDQLGRMDKLSKLNGSFDCFEAVAGVYASLKKLYDHEKAAALALLSSNEPDPDEKAVREVMCKKSGRPAMNERDNVGLRLDYWMKQRHVLPPKYTKRNSEAGAMDVDEASSDDEISQEGIFSMLIECEASPPAPPELQYPAVRSSSNWVGDPVDQPADEQSGHFGPGINWQEPPATFINEQNASQHDELQIPSAHLGKKPNVRLVAKLDPPLVMPYQVAVSILNAAGATIPEHFNLHPRTYPGLVIQPNMTEELNAIPSGELKHLRSDRVVTVLSKLDGGSAEKSVHRNSIFVNVAKMEDGPAILGVQLEQVPFFHPRQIVELLPTLRQYAFMNTLLSTSFSPTSSPNQPEVNGSGPQALKRRVDIAYIPAVGPCMVVAFSTASRDPDEGLIDELCKDSSDEAHMSEESDAWLSQFASGVIEFDVLPNADLHLRKQSVVRGFDSATNSTSNVEAQNDASVGEKITKALAVSEDIGLWIEWLAANRDALRK